VAVQDYYNHTAGKCDVLRKSPR